MAVKDGLGPPPVSQTAKRHFLNRLETSSKPGLFLRFCIANCHPARVLLEPAFVLRPVAQSAKRYFLNRLETSSKP